MEVTDLLSSTRQFVDELEKYRALWESTTHWYARKTFLRHNWENFEDKDQLICLSTAWANINFMGNRYPEKVMTQIKELEKGMSSAHTLLLEADKQVIGHIEPLSLADDLLLDIEKLPKTMKPLSFVKSSDNDSTFCTNESAPVDELETNKNETKIHQGKSADDADGSVVKKKKKKKKPTLAPTFAVPLKPAVLEEEKAADTLQMPAVDNSMDVDETNTVSTEFMDVDAPETLDQSPPVDPVVLNKCSETDFMEKDLPCPASPLPTTNGEEISPYHNRMKRKKSVVKHLSLGFKGRSMKYYTLENSVTILEQAAKRIQQNLYFACERLENKHFPQFRQWAKKYCDDHTKLKEGMWVGDLYLGEIFLSQSFTFNKDMAENLAARAAIELLRKKPLHVVCVKRNTVDGTTYVWQHAASPKNHVLPDELPPLISNSALWDFVSSSLKYSFLDATMEETSVGENKARKTDIILPRNFVLIKHNDNPVNIINDSIQSFMLDAEYKFDDNGNCTLIIAGLKIATAKGEDESEAKHAAAKEAVRVLSENHSTAVVKGRPKGDPSQGLSRDSVIGGLKKDELHIIGEDNIGNQLLRKMGWSGGGLGSDGQGIAQPVVATGSFRRKAGLGAEKKTKREIEDEKRLKKGKKSQITPKDANILLRDYKSKGCIGPLTLSAELTQHERKVIHFAANRAGLRSKSYGKGENRYLVVCSKDN